MTCLSFFRFTLYPAGSGIGNGSLELRNWTPHFSRNSGFIVCWVAELITFLLTRVGIESTTCHVYIQSHAYAPTPRLTSEFLFTLWWKFLWILFSASLFSLYKSVSRRNVMSRYSVEQSIETLYCFRPKLKTLNVKWTNPTPVFVYMNIIFVFSSSQTTCSWVLFSIKKSIKLLKGLKYSALSFKNKRKCTIIKKIAYLHTVYLTYLYL